MILSNAARYAKTIDKTANRQNIREYLYLEELAQGFVISVTPIIPINTVCTDRQIDSVRIVEFET